MRHLRSTIGIALAATLLAAACGSDDSGTSDADGFAGTITIGAALSETGRFAVEGGDARKGYDTWLTWVNDVYGGIKVGSDRYRAEIIYYDDESDAETADLLVERLIDDDGVDFLLGPYSSTLTKGTSAIAEDRGVLMVESTGVSDSLFERGFENLFMVSNLASDYTRTGIEALAEAGARTAVIAYEDTLFPTTVAEGAVRHLEAHGIEVLARETYPLGVADDPAGVADINDMMTRFRDLDPDIFVGGGHYDDAVLFVRTAAEVGFEPDAMLITVGPSNPRLIDDLGADVNGVVGPTAWEPSMSYEGAYFGSASDYAAYYEGLWGEPPVYQAASTSAAALALHLGIEAAGSTDTDDVREALRGLQAETFWGPIGFDERGANVLRSMGVVQVQDGNIEVVGPTDAASGTLQYPAG